MSNFTEILIEQYDQSVLSAADLLPYLVEAIIPLYEFYLEAATTCNDAYSEELIGIEEFFRPIFAQYYSDPKLYPARVFDDLLALFARRNALLPTQLH